MKSFFPAPAIFLILCLNVSGSDKVIPLSPEEAIKTIEVPKGYHLEVVASEPMVQEPTSFVFDGNGAVYVCEWLTYMQDEHATGQMEPVSRIVKLVDTDGDGRMDKRTVFADKILLPRAILPLQDRILVILTGANSVWSFFDNDSDGVSDRRELSFEGKENTANIEHQSSGLLWNLDNKIYNNHHDFKYQEGKLTSLVYRPKKMSQWGLSRDDEGRTYSSRNGDPCYNFQFPAAYPKLIKFDDHAPGYLVPYSICAMEDQSSGGYQHDKKIILYKFSSTSGSTVFRSHLMPEFYGKVITCENVGRLLRMTDIDWSSGKGITSNSFPGTEFIRSTDPLFRPTWAETGPDGCFYFCDMYRGIIQEKHWFPTKGDHPWVERYKRVKENGMIDVVRHGRIYRLVPDAKAPGPLPRMRNEASEELVFYLSHENGWWRDCAQKLVVSRGDLSAVPALKVLLKGDSSVNAVVHALWCLEGLDALKPDMVKDALKSPEPRVRKAGLQLVERYLKEGEYLSDVRKLIDDKDLTVITQLYVSLGQSENGDVRAFRDEVVSRYADHPLITADIRRIKGEKKEESAMKGASEEVKRGREIYEVFCITCHGKEGMGKVVDREWLAPSFVSSIRFKKKDINSIARILMKGMSGPIYGRDYAEDMMIPLEHMYTDQQMADVVNYIGARFHRWDDTVGVEPFARIRKELKDRNVPWTHDELLKLKDE